MYYSSIGGVKLSVFLEKSSENRDVARIAAEKGYFNSATNRIYYSLFQKILHILQKREIDVPEQNGPNDKRNSHQRTIDTMIQEVLSNQREKNEFLRLHMIRKSRNKADYKLNSINKTVYNSQIKASADKIHNVLDSYI